MRLNVGDQLIFYDHVVDLDLGDPIGSQLVSGDWRLSSSLIWLLSSLRPGDSVLDLGAHFGTFAIPAAVLGARVTAVEGSPRNAAVLKAACDQNRLSSIDIVTTVVDRAAGIVDFVELGPYGTISTAELNSESGYPTIRSRATTVDLLPGAPFAWAKIDIEGKEQAVLTGATTTLRDLRGMVFESNGYMLHKQGTSPAETIRTLNSAGFTVYEVEGSTLRPLRDPFIQPATIVDYVAVSGDPAIPAGWDCRGPRDDVGILEALLSETQHPVLEHREHADRTISQLSRQMSRLMRKRSLQSAHS